MPGEYREAQLNYNFRFPSVREIDNLKLEELKTIAEENDDKFLKIMERNQVPFFGLHGGSQKSIENIKSFAGKPDEECVLMVTTFFNKPDDKKVFLNSLYACARYSSPYALQKMNRENFDEPGAVVVINLESESGKNEAVPESMSLSDRYLDTDVVAEQATVGIYGSEYSKRIIGFVGDEGHLQYHNIKVSQVGHLDIEHLLDSKKPFPIDEKKILTLEKISWQRILYDAFKALKLIE